MENRKIKAVIFDLGNVLIDFDHTRAASRISKFCAQTPAEIYELFFDSGITGLFEAGKISPDDFFAEIKKVLGLRLDYAQFVPIWNEIFFLSPKNRAVYSIAKDLKIRYKLALLSNINILHFEYLKKNFPVFDAFHKIIASCETGFTKPDRAIYQIALGALEVSAEEVFYTDDRAELIKSARGLGMNSFVFTGVEQLKKDLSGAGLGINENAFCS